MKHVTICETDRQEAIAKRWLLARLRTIRAGMMLVVAQVDEIGLDLKDDRITAEMAMLDVTALEQMPVHVAAHVCSPTESDAR